jgi:hypothetical protein
MIQVKGIRMKGAARTPSCFAVAGPPAVPECRKAASLAVAAGAYVKSVQRSQVRPVFAHRSGHLFGLHEGSAAGSILHLVCTRAGIPWFDMTWKLNELERPE